MTGYASDAAVSTSGSNGNGSMVPVNSGAILNALKTPNSEPNYAQENHRVDKIGDPDKRAFTYFVLTGGRMIYASAIRLAVLKFLMSMSATADVLALASLRSGLEQNTTGTATTVKWRGSRCLFEDERRMRSRRRTRWLGELRDKQADADRTQNPGVVGCGWGVHASWVRADYSMAITTVGFARATGVTTTRAGEFVKDRRRRI